MWSSEVSLTEEVVDGRASMICLENRRLCGGGGVMCRWGDGEMMIGDLCQMEVTLLHPGVPPGEEGVYFG